MHHTVFMSVLFDLNEDAPVERKYSINLTNAVSLNVDDALCRR